jgi:hypothetical protein
MNYFEVDLSKLKDVELENKMQDLTQKYFQTSNAAIRSQISMYMDLFKSELAERRSKQLNEMYQKRNKDLDGLINVS